MTRPDLRTAADSRGVRDREAGGGRDPDEALAAEEVSSTRPLRRIKSPGPPRPPRSPGSPAQTLPRIPDRWWFLAAWLIALSIFILTAPGHIIFDTKLGVDINSAEFYARLWPLWNPLEWFGTLQDQYIGYAIPMAPFFLIGQALHLPVWIIERLWLSVIVAAGFAGMVKLAAALRIGSPASRLTAGAVFALWPTFTIVIGSTSAAALPGLMVPWAVLPLVSAVQGRTSITKAVARSGVAIVLMGGVNAVSTLAVLVLPGMYVLVSARGRQRVKLVIGWAAAVLAATAWWLIPLLLQGRYSFNFLPYIEQSSTTARTTSAAAVLRGAGTWTAYFNIGGIPWLKAGWAEVAAPAAVLASAIVSATGLYGLARRNMPARRWLLCSVGLAALIAMAGYFGPLGDPFHLQVDQLLDGALAPFRSTYKFEPVIGAAIALGCAHALSIFWQRSVRLGSRARAASSTLTAPLVALALAGLAVPQLSGEILQQGSFAQVPGYWYQTARYLAEHAARQTAMLVPADAHGQYSWGDPIDDPMEPLASSPWVERGLVPYGGAGSQQVLDTIESAVESDQQVPGLAAYLARAGIRYLVVRNDLSPQMIGYTPPQDANETLALSGFKRVAAFGPMIASTPVYPQVTGIIPGYAPEYPAVEIFEAAQPSLWPAGPARAVPVRSTMLVNGGADSLLQLAGQQVLGPARPTVIAGDQLAGRPALWAVTDGQRRADNSFGSTQNFASFTYTAAETNPPDDPLGGGGGPPRQLLPVTAKGHQTVAVLSGAASVTASSYGSWLTESPQYDPVNAFDGNPSTAWAEGDPITPVGQWIQINFNHPVDVPATIGISLLDDVYTRSIANQLEVTTAAGRASTQTVQTSSTQPLHAPPGTTTWLRITITGASNVIAGNPGAGISDVSIPGVRVTRYLQPAEDPAGLQAGKVAFSFHQQAASPYQEQSQLTSQVPSPVLARTFMLPSAQRLALTAEALPNPGPYLNEMLIRQTPRSAGTFQAFASSSWQWLPALGADNLFNAASYTPWLAASTDPSPTLEVRWRGVRTIRKLVLAAADGIAAVPTTVQVGSPAGARLARVEPGGVVRVSPPIRTRTLYLSFPTLAANAAGDVQAGQPATLPVGLSKVTIPALHGLTLAMPTASTPLRLPCGRGPAVSIDGHLYQTSVSGTLGDLTGLLPVGVRVCATGGKVNLAAGRHWLLAKPSKVFTITDLTLQGQSGSAGQLPKPSTRRVRILAWQPDSRTVRIGPGSESYLEIHQNFNQGWIATLDGKPLHAAVLDGWQQAFVVPAGQGGVITLTFAPAATYHAGIVVSAAAILGLIGLALGLRLPRRRRRRLGPQDQPGAIATPTAQPAAAGPTANRGWLQRAAPARLDWQGHESLAAAGGRHRHGSTMSRWINDARAGADQAQHAAATDPRPDGQAEAAGHGQARSRMARLSGIRNWTVLVPLAVVIFIAGGAVAIVVPVLAIIDSFRPRWMPRIAAVAMLAAGVACVETRTPAALGSGAFSGVAQVFALTALAAALMPAFEPDAPTLSGSAANLDGLSLPAAQPALSLPAAPGGSDAQLRYAGPPYRPLPASQPASTGTRQQPPWAAAPKPQTPMLPPFDAQQARPQPTAQPPVGPQPAAAPARRRLGIRTAKTEMRPTGTRPDPRRPE